MSKIARKLCDEIEGSTNAFKGKEYHRNACNYDVRTTGNVVVEKQRKNLQCNDRSSSRITKFKSEDTILDSTRTYVNTAVNTTIKGSFVNDECVTLVRKRADIKCVCRTPSRCSFSTRVRHAKQVQTFDNKLFSKLSDKACFHCVETTTRGTQFLVVPGIQDRVDNVIRDMARRNLRQTHSSRRHSLNTQPSNVKRECQTGLMSKQKSPVLRTGTQANRSQNNDRQESTKNFMKIPSVNFMGARRWSLSQYITRGPDF